MPRQRDPQLMPNPKANMWDLIAYYLRIQRTRRGLSQEAMGRIMKIGKSKVSRLELGEEKLTQPQATLIDQAWETGGIFALLVWYASIGHDPQWFAQYIHLEQRAAMLRIWESSVIPGLLQTEDYARSLLSVALEPDLDGALLRRMQRQTMLGGENPPHMAVLISQNALEWPIGSPEIMEGQLDRLLEVASLPHVVLRVLPRTWEVGAHLGLNGGFNILSADDFTVAYIESTGSGRLVSSPADVRSYEVRYERIGARALAEAPSRDLIKQVKESIR